MNLLFFFLASSISRRGETFQVHLLQPQLQAAERAGGASGAVLQLPEEPPGCRQHADGAG